MLPPDPRSHLPVRRALPRHRYRQCQLLSLGRCHPSRWYQGPAFHRQRLLAEYVLLFLSLAISSNASVASAWSAGSSDLYTSSRALYGLAKTGQAPRIFARTNRYGTPWVSLCLSTALGLLAYMGVSETSNKVFNWFANMSSVTGMLNWFGICITLIRFRKGLKVRSVFLSCP